ncbi:MAG TPA: secretion protein HlyD [Stellaceae bacterium]|nr:secretion protein HlyD [Stellaceae bacterium]
MKMRLLMVPLLAAAAAAGGYAYYRTLPRAQGAHGLVLLGNVDVRDVDLAFKQGGRIVRMAVDEGDRVKTGETIAALDEHYFADDLRIARARESAQEANLAKLVHGSRPEEIAQARANVALAAANAENRAVTMRRQKMLLSTSVASRQAYDDAVAASHQADAQLDYAKAALQLAVAGPRQEDIDAARAQLALEQANVSVAERALSDATLHAPSDGIVLTRVREPGAIVAAGETVYTVALLTPVWVRAYVGEPDLGRVHPGMAATVHTDSAPNRVYHGHVGFISPVAEFTPKNVETRQLRTDLVYRLRVIVDDPDQGLRQGMPVTVTLDTAPGGR